MPLDLPTGSVAIGTRTLGVVQPQTKLEGTPQGFARMFQMEKQENPVSPHVPRIDTKTNRNFFVTGGDPSEIRTWFYLGGKK